MVVKDFTDYKKNIKDMDFDKINRDLKRSVDKIIIHASDTYENMDIGKIEITQWHIMRGFSDIVFVKGGGT